MNLQVFVRKTDLAGTDPVRVIAYYPAAPVLDRNLHGADCTVMLLDATSLDMTANPYLLRVDWRQDMALIVNAESERRLAEVFPDYMQRNASADIGRSTLMYGTDTPSWPQDALDRKAENDRGWQYVSAVRQSSDALSIDLAIIDPTADEHWPTVPSPPIYIAPVP